MTDPVQKYIEASDNASDYADHIIEGINQRALEDIDDLYRSEENRDLELWAEFGVSPDVTIADYEDTDPKERDLEWSLGIAGISAAASTQFFLDNREDTIIKPTAYREQVMSVFVLTEMQLITAGKRGVEIVGIERFQALQARFVEEFAFLAELDNRVLYHTLLTNEAILPVEQQIARASGYVSRLTNYRPGSPQFKEAVANLIKTDSGRNLQAMNRRAVERVYSWREANGDNNTKMVWIGEGGPNTCSYCLARFGEIKTYGQWLLEGMPGADVCAGGDS